MKLLFALNHPAHYYLFKYIIIGLQEKGHKIHIVIKEKDVLAQLLIHENISYTKISKKQNVESKWSIISKGAIELIYRDFRLLNFVKNKKPDILIGTDIAITHVGKLLKIPSIVYNEDDFEINKFFCKLSYPFASWIVSPEYTSVGKFINKKISYIGIQKMAYLNPKYFEPDNSVLEKIGVNKGELFFIIRLVSLTSGHDIEAKHRGINNSLLKKIIDFLSDFGTVFISSEKDLPKQFTNYQISVNVNEVHSLMYYASLFIGDSQTMCAEAGILGTPFIRINDFVGKIKYLDDLENNYNLGWGVNPDNPERVLDIVKSLMTKKNIKYEWQQKVSNLFKEKIDLTSFSVWLLNNYPQSVITMKENPDYQYKFK